ncbi:hypothetical protein FEE95_00875 [Maribacter algarum]|uniref:Baseplate protein J-like domain-containing protein n=1 Tax=Maribacter algarum (ex Zhang et al. 2020) TaxID=2578118 RepID=A0A5S3PSP5_9FLAO|nr:hypothetical protein [Maribacter algarum]TMM58011.1 hypothetical protein FEE95_00875 [Maribacter algarum]
MSDCSENKTPLIRTGTSQTQRVLPKFSPKSVEIIDKTTEDWMVWGGRFSEHIQYTDLNNASVGTMKPFFKNNISAQLALVASYKPDDLSKYIREKLIYIETNTAGLKEAYTELFNIVFSYFLVIDRLFLTTKSDSEYNTILLRHVLAKIKPLESRTFAYYKASIEGTALQRLIIPSEKVDLDIFYEPIIGHENFVATGLSSLDENRFVPPEDFIFYYNEALADSSIFGGLTGFRKRIKYVTQHNFFTSILDEITASTNYITRLSQKYITKYLTNWSKHRPNYTLYLSWLQLLDGTKNHLNELTGRHLDFYYKDVLRLKPLSQEPDNAFLVLELNKITPSYAIKEDTLFMGPKDKTGNTITYKSIRETVLNQAKIKHLSSLYCADANDNTTLQPGNDRRLFAAPIANSADGLGEEIAEDVIAWHPFHIKEYKNGEISSINMPKAEVGFAVASHYLRLKEGYRTITLELITSGLFDIDVFSYDAYITTEKGWLKIELPVLELNKSSIGLVSQLTFSLTIEGDKEAVTGYNRDVHQGNFNTTEPVLKIVLAHKDSEDFIYDKLSNAGVARIDLSVGVGQITSYNEDGIKNLELYNDTSPLDPSKPFHPWGPEPTVGSSFIIGSDEIFYKKGANIQLNFKWKDYPLNSSGGINSGAIDFDGYGAVTYNSTNSVAGPNTPNVKISKLSKNKWEVLELYDDENVFTSPSGSSAIERVILGVDLSEDSEEEIFLSKNEAWEEYGANSSKGFIKVSLKNDFGHRDYYSALLNYSKVEGLLSAPVYPYQPTLESFSISYTANCSISVYDNFEDGPGKFFHIGPFGDNAQHRSLQGYFPPKLVNKLIYKTPINYKSQGSLFIGLENLFPGDTQSILFQLQEGSEDPLLEKPEEHLIWEYLKANDVWEEFDDDGVGDNTSGLIESGLINFVIPKDASLVHASFESNLIWIRCSVKEAPDAVAKIIGVHPNAIQVQRVLPETITYDTMISQAGEIKKLRDPDARIKKINQPFSSFGGRPQDEEFYQRASERLRHKGRPINIWDVERQILESFPMNRVKCLNHTKIEGSISEGNLIYNEVAPGHVSVITIPDLANRNDTDPLRPYTKKSTLNKIKKFLEARTSCHVKIHTAQPDFEEVKVKCSITLQEEFTDINYYKEVIQNDIMNFLSPWAFTSNKELNFGGRIHQSVLIDFIEELPYVDFLIDFELRHLTSSGDDIKVDEVIASTARSILVSVPANKHDLTVLLNTPEVITDIDCKDD